MSTTRGRGREECRSWWNGRWAADAITHLLAWPVRVHRARKMMLQLAKLCDHELRDIGLTRQDLCDTSALPFDADPSFHLRRRAEARRR